MVIRLPSVVIDIAPLKLNDATLKIGEDHTFKK